MGGTINKLTFSSLMLQTENEAVQRNVRGGKNKRSYTTAEGQEVARELLKEPDRAVNWRVFLGSYCVEKPSASILFTPPCVLLCRPIWVILWVASSNSSAVTDLYSVRVSVRICQSLTTVVAPLLDSTAHPFNFCLCWTNPVWLLQQYHDLRAQSVAW